MPRETCLMLGARLIDVSESFLLFAQADRSSDLGFVDPQKRLIEISVAGQDLVIEQSPSLLRSNRAEGTTGAGEGAYGLLFNLMGGPECV